MTAASYGAQCLPGHNLPPLHPYGWNIYSCFIGFSHRSGLNSAESWPQVFESFIKWPNGIRMQVFLGIFCPVYKVISVLLIREVNGTIIFYLNLKKFNVKHLTLDKKISEGAETAFNEFGQTGTDRY